MGVVKKTEGKSPDDELLQLNFPMEHLVSRVVAAGYDEPPENADIVPWFACVTLKVILDERGIVVSREKLAGMASVVLGFISESSAMQTLHSGLNPSVITHRRRARTGSKSAEAVGGLRSKSQSTS